MIKLKEQVLATTRALVAHDLNRAAAGNVSARSRDGFIISPTGMKYEDCVPDDMVSVGMDGASNDKRKPSSEWRFHRDIYRHFRDAGAVIHAHSPFATSLACLNKEVPAFHYMIARFGGNNVRCARYATFGTQELSDVIIAALQDRCACLMSHHGMVVYGRDVDHALTLAIELETLCEQYWRVLQIGKPQLLSDEEMARVLEKFGGYGQQ